MVNNVAGGPITMGAGADGGSVTIPSIMISQADGEALMLPYNQVKLLTQNLSMRQTTRTLITTTKLLLTNTVTGFQID